MSLTLRQFFAALDIATAMRESRPSRIGDLDQFARRFPQEVSLRENGTPSERYDRLSVVRIGGHTAISVRHIPAGSPPPLEIREAGGWVGLG